MSPAKKNAGRFSYLAAAVDAPAEQQQDQGTDRQPDDTTQVRGDGTSRDAANDGRGEGRNRTQPRSRRSSRKPSTEDLASKGKGRMKQRRSQLNVRIPTPQAACIGQGRA